MWERLNLWGANPLDRYERWQVDKWGGHHPDPAAERVERLADEHGLALLGLAVSLVGDRQAAEEVVQDALYQAYRHIHRGRPVTRAWLSQAVVWGARATRHQSWWRRTVATENVPPPAPAMPEGSVVAAMRQLPKPLAEVALLHYWAGFTVDEVHQMLHIPAGTVKSRLYRARHVLRQALSDTLLEDGEAVPHHPDQGNEGGPS